LNAHRGLGRPLRAARHGPIIRAIWIVAFQLGDPQQALASYDVKDVDAQAFLPIEDPARRLDDLPVAPASNLRGLRGALRVISQAPDILTPSIPPAFSPSATGKTHDWRIGRRQAGAGTALHG
jgi:hypothetical protein